MTPNRHLAWIRENADRMADVGGQSLDAPVPACPGWDVADTLSHTGWVHRRNAARFNLPEGTQLTAEVSIAAGLPPEAGSTQRPEGNLVAWFRQGVNLLQQTFEGTSPTKRITSLFGTHTPSLHLRRMVHETAVHRRDVEDAVDLPTGFDPTLATDGIDELLDLWVPRTFSYGDFGGTGQVIGLRATDTGGAWVITVQPETTEWQR